MIIIFLKLVLLFTVVPIVELALLIEIGSRIGVIFTIFIVLITGVIGAALAKSQGFIVVNKIKKNLNKGVIPTEHMIGGLLILLGGAMLLTPGILTDITGFLLIIPFSREVIVKLVKKIFKKHIEKVNIRSSKGFSDRKDQDKRSDYVDIEYEEDNK